jgi:hypothetical protein
MNVWTTIIAGIVIASATWVLSQFRLSAYIARQLFGPRLRWDVDQRDGSEIQVPILNPSGQPNGNSLSYFRVLVKNDKGRVATGVRGYLTDVRRFDLTLHRYVKIGFCDTIPLVWSYRSADSIEIPFGIIQFLDVASVVLDASGRVIHGPELCISPLPTVYKNMLRTGGKYALRIFVQADAFIVEDMGMAFEWNGMEGQPKIEIRPFRSFLGDFQ